VYEITVFKTLDIRQWRTIIPDRWETKVSLAYHLEGFYAWCMEQELRWSLLIYLIEETKLEVNRRL